MVCDHQALRYLKGGERYTEGLKNNGGEARKVCATSRLHLDHLFELIPKTKLERYLQ
jgi:hypothetical protein